MREAKHLRTLKVYELVQSQFLTLEIVGGKVVKWWVAYGNDHDQDTGTDLASARAFAYARGFAIPY